MSFLIGTSGIVHPLIQELLLRSLIPTEDKTILILKLHRSLTVSNDPLHSDLFDSGKNLHQTGLYIFQIIRVMAVPEVACMKLGMDFSLALIMISLFVMIVLLV